MSVGLPVGEQFKLHEPGRLRLGYAYSYSDADHFYFGEKRDHAVERGPQPTTLTNEHTATLEYDLPAKFSLIGEVPFLYTRQKREAGPVAGTMTAAGLGDIRLLSRYWFTDENPPFRLYGIFGVRIPTGESDEKFLSQTGNRVTKDVAAQSGTGNFAGVLELGGTSQLTDSFALFYQGRYIFAPETETDANNFRFELTGIGPRKNSDSDAATLRIGGNLNFGTLLRETFRGEEPFQPLDGLAGQVIFDTAWVPYDDLIGASGGFRRAGVILFVGPGLTWAPYENLTLSVSTPFTVYRKIQRNGGNVPEWVFQTSITMTY